MHAIYWVHVPKTSSSFMRTVLSFACGPNAADFPNLDTLHIARISGSCNGARSSLQAGRDHSWMHMPIPLQLRSHLPTVIMNFRAPLQRILSAAHYMQQQPGVGYCCGTGGGIQPHGGSWGWTSTDRLQAYNATLLGGEVGVRAFLAVLHQVHALTGCATKMLLGIGCQQRYDLRTHEIRQAVGFVNQLGFVALMSGIHAYERSVCLLHARFGGSVTQCSHSAWLHAWILRVAHQSCKLAIS